MMKTKKSAGLIIGSVTSLNRRQAGAPSICSASYRWRGTPYSAARRITIVPPQAQMSMSAMLGLIQCGSVVQYGPGSPTARKPLSTMPIRPLKRKRSRTPTATGGDVREIEDRAEEARQLADSHQKHRQ